jgi:hypothetical protein
LPSVHELLVSIASLGSLGLLEPHLRLRLRLR